MRSIAHLANFGGCDGWRFRFSDASTFLQSKVANCCNPLTNLSNSRLWFSRSIGFLVIKPIAFRLGIRLVEVAVS